MSSHESHRERANSHDEQGGEEEWKGGGTHLARHIIIK